MRRVAVTFCLSVPLLWAVVASAVTQPPGSPGDSLRSRIAWQIALERVGFSPGLIDGKGGSRTELATREFQRSRGMTETGTLDTATSSALGIDPVGAMRSYTIEANDIAQVGPLPKGWTAKSLADRLPYPSLEEMLAEKFHCSKSVLRQLNPGVDFSRLHTGLSLTVPDIRPASLPQGRRIVVDLSAKLIRVLDASGQTLGLFHCSVAANKANLPSGRASVAVISRNPTYVFDPKMWPEAKNDRKKLLIPPGPRNPVGLCWIGLSLPGYGIHGTPAPELIGKTGSHGCIRLTNWDALRLGDMVRVGTPVAFQSN